MSVRRAVLVLVERDSSPTIPNEIAQLEPDEVGYLSDHVETLRSRASDTNALHARYQPGSDVPKLLGRLSTCTDDEFLTIVETFASRLHAQMRAVTNPSPGILAVVSSGDGDTADVASVLKLDATYEAARYIRGVDRIRINVLRDLLPSPGELQKGLSTADPRPESELIIRDRNVEAARYFLNAFQVKVSPRPRDTSRELLDAIAHLPEEEIPRAYSLAAQVEGQADVVVAELHEQFADLDTDREAFGARGAVPGMLHPDKIAARPMRVKADGFVIEVPADRSDRVAWESRGDGWVITIQTDTRPHWVAR